MPDMINPQKGIDLMNNDSIINRILFAVTIFQHSLELPSGLGLLRGEISSVVVAVLFIFHNRCKVENLHGSDSRKP
jgi:hypothetical protein